MLPRASLRTLAATACVLLTAAAGFAADAIILRSEEHTSELQSHHDLVCRLLLEKKNKRTKSV